MWGDDTSSSQGTVSWRDLEGGRSQRANGVEGRTDGCPPRPGVRVRGCDPHGSLIEVVACVGCF